MSRKPIAYNLRPIAGAHVRRYVSRMTLRYASAALALTSFVAGCSGSSQSTAVPSLSVEHTNSTSVRTMADLVRTRVRSASTSFRVDRVSGWIDASAEIDTADDAQSDVVESTASTRHLRQLLYVSDVPEPTVATAPGLVKIYAGLAPSSALHQVGEITGLDTPTRIAVDRFANVYVVQTDFGAPVLEFRRGETHPFRTLDTAGAIATSIAVAEDGTVYVGTGSTSVPATLFVYAPGATAPTSHLDGPFGDGINDLLIDRDGNVYFDYVVIDSGGFIGRYAFGSTSADENLGFPDSPLNAALLRDGSMVIAPMDASQIDRFARGQLVLGGTFPVRFVQSFCLNRAQSALYGGGAGTITTYAFPAGTVLHTLTLGTIDLNFGLAVSPRPHPPHAF